MVDLALDAAGAAPRDNDLAACDRQTSTLILIDGKAMAWVERGPCNLNWTVRPMLPCDDIERVERLDVRQSLLRPCHKVDCAASAVDDRRSKNPDRTQEGAVHIRLGCAVWEMR